LKNALTYYDAGVVVVKSKVVGLVPEAILRILNLQIHGHHCTSVVGSRLDRFFKEEENILFSKRTRLLVALYIFTTLALYITHDDNVGPELSLVAFFITISGKF
jgi:hypothetical protein